MVNSFLLMSRCFHELKHELHHVRTVRSLGKIINIGSKSLSLGICVNLMASNYYPGVAAQELQ